MNTTIALLKGAETKGLRVLAVGGFILASLGVCAAAEAQQTQSIEKKTVKKEVVSGELAPTTILANRTETDLSKVGSSVTVLDTEVLKKEGVRFFSDALKFVPGVISDTSSGQRGTTSSIFIRGNKSDYSGMMVDGIRMTGTSFRQGNFVGTANLLGMSNLEILKGPQGVVYGASAISGVVGISNKKGEGPMSGALLLEGGSYDTFNAMLGVQGESDGFAYSLNVGSEQTDNDLPNNKFNAFSTALRLDYAVNDSFRLGVTFRNQNSNLILPKYSDTKYPKASDIDYDYNLTTFFAEYDVNDVWRSKLTLGYYDENYTYAPINRNSSLYESQKYSAYWDNTLKWNEEFTTVIGTAFERSRYQKNPLSTERDQLAIYFNQIWSPVENLTFTGGLRFEDYEDDAEKGFNGDVTTWRVASAYTVAQTNSILRASIGTGFQLPQFSQLYGAFGPNPNLNPAESIGWDVGIEQPFFDGKYKLGLTYFATRVENAIDWHSHPTNWRLSEYRNTPGITETSGIEAFAEGNFLNDRLSAVLTYTWLDRDYFSDQRELPENVLSLRVDGQVTDQLNIGVTSTYTDKRALYGNSLDDYALVNLYANYAFNDHVKLTARVDNVFDKEYYYGIAPGFFGGGETVRPGRGVAYFAGVTYTW